MWNTEYNQKYSPSSPVGDIFVINALFSAKYHQDAIPPILATIYNTRILENEKKITVVAIRIKHVVTNNLLYPILSAILQKRYPNSKLPIRNIPINVDFIHSLAP